MPTDLGVWLRQQREAHGWTRPEMARRLIQAGHAKGDKSMPGTDSMCHNIYRWERGADRPSERYKLCYCQALAIPLSHFGPQQPDHQPAATQTPETSAMATTPGLHVTTPLAQAPHAVPGLADPRLFASAAVAYRGMQASDMGDSLVEREVLMAAHEGSENAERAEERGIGDATLEQFRADVIRLSREYMTGEPFPLFLEMRRVRGRMHAALDRRMWPRDATTLYFLLGCINGLMAVAADDLGYPIAAEELCRAGWAYAVAIDQRGLMAKLRLDLASLAYWNGRPREAAELASSGLEYLAVGPTGVQLHLKYGRAVARLGDADSARQAIAAADEAREREYRDDLVEIGGEFDLSRASERYLVGSVLIEIPAAANEAGTELERAAELYAAGPGRDETHGYGMEALARINLADARLRAGAVEAASDALSPVLSMPLGKRIDPIPQRLGRTRAELAQPIFRGSVQARELDERIEEFGRETITTGLHGLSGSPG